MHSQICISCFQSLHPAVLLLALVYLLICTVVELLFFHGLLDLGPFAFFSEKIFHFSIGCRTKIFGKLGKKRRGALGWGGGRARFFHLFITENSVAVNLKTLSLYVCVCVCVFPIWSSISFSFIKFSYGDWICFTILGTWCWGNSWKYLWVHFLIAQVH